MPKSIQKRQEEDVQFKLEMKTVGQYDDFDVFHGKVRIGQLTLIRSESAKRFVKQLTKHGCLVWINEEGKVKG